MRVEFIDLPFLLHAHNLDGKSRKRVYHTILVDHRFKETVFVMVKSIKSTSNNKYKVTT